MKKRLFALLLCLITAAGSINCAYAANENSFSSSAADIRGVDVSSYFSLRNSSVGFKDFDGNELDDNGFFAFLKSCSVNYIRVRIWNDPYDSSGNGYGGGNCDLDNAVRLGRLATANGMKLFADFHLSDFWADPAKQTVPKAWKALSLDEKQTAVYEYIRSSLEALKKNGADIGMVQIGNEINNGLCGETSTQNISLLLKSGFSAVADTDSNILRAVHYTDPDKGAFVYFAENLKKYGVDYDVFASSYYPYWHSAADNLSAELKKISEGYGKYVLIAETAYPFTSEDSDFFANNISGFEQSLVYPVSINGQAEAVRNAFRAVSAVGDKGLGVFYWEPAWISVGTGSYEENLALWERFGSGWQSSFAAEYCEDKAIYHGGSSWDNQAMFNKNGYPLDSLRVFSEFDKASSVTGDVNLDGVVSVDDATLLQKYLAQLESLSENQLALSDLNCDGVIDVSDATEIQKRISKSSTSTGNSCRRLHII